MRVLLIAPTDPGSLGDEAMLQAATSVLRTSGFRVDIGSAISGRRYRRIEGARRTIGLRPGDHDLASLLRIFAGYEHVLLIGADVMDGYYSEERSAWRAELLGVAGRVAGHAALVSFSWCDTPTPASAAALRGLGRRIRLWSRDPVSRERLARLLARDVGGSADLAFLLDARDATGTAAGDIAWVRERRSHGPVVGLNLAKTPFLELLDEGLTFEALLERFSAETQAILAAHPTASVLLIPHDRRTDRNDLVLGGLLERAVVERDATTRDRIRLVEAHRPSAAALKLLAGMTSVVVSSRMHLTIAALGSGTPAATLAYQGKTEGLFQHFPGLGDWSIDPREALAPGAISAWVGRLLAREAELRALIDAALPSVRELALRNLPVPARRSRA
jgi:polysaccharide pyruvyl transferase WcaK-like protein